MLNYLILEYNFMFLKTANETIKNKKLSQILSSYNKQYEWTDVSTGKPITYV